MRDGLVTDVVLRWAVVSILIGSACGCAVARHDPQRSHAVVRVADVVRTREPDRSIRPVAWQEDSSRRGTPFELVFPDIGDHRPPASEDADESPTSKSLTDEPTEKDDPADEVTPLPIELPETGAAEKPAADELTLDNIRRTSVASLVLRAVARSPKVAAARHRAAAASQKITQARSYEDPRLGTTYAPIDSNSLQTAGGRIPLSLTLSQKMPWRDKLEARACVASEEARRLSVLATEAELQVALDVEMAAADLWYTDTAIEIARSDRGLLEALEEVAKARVRSGGSQQDVLSARLEADRLDNRIASLRRLRGVAVARLASLLGESPDVTEELRIELPEVSGGGDIDRLIDEAVACRPELKSLLFAVRRDRQERRLACLNRYPDFDVGVGWQSVTRDEAISPVANGHDNVNLLIGVTLPLRHSRIEARIREAEQQFFASSRDYDAAVDAVRRDVLSAAVRLETFAEQLRLHEETLLPRSQQVLDVSMADYRGGKVTFIQVTQNFLAVLTLRTEAARLRSELVKSAAELQRATGCDRHAAIARP